MLTTLNKINNQLDEWSKEIKINTLATGKTKRFGSETLKNILLKEVPMGKRSTDISLLLDWFKSNLPSKIGDLEQMLQLLDPIIQKLHPQIVNLNVIYSRFRKHIEQRYGRPSPEYELSRTSIFGISQDQITQILQKKTKKLAQNNRSLSKYKAKDIYDTIKRAIGGDWIDQSIAILLACGMRSIELFTISEFQEVKDRPDMIRQIGMAKDPEVAKGLKTKSDRVVVKPIILLDIHTVLKSIQRIRKHIDHNKSNKYITGSVNTKINNRLKDYLPNTKGHGLRKIYGNLSYKTSELGKNRSLISYLSEVLGHSSEISTSSLFYSTVDVQMNGFEAPRDLIQALEKSNTENRELHARLARLELKIDSLDTRVLVGGVRLDKIPKGGSAESRYKKAVKLLTDLGIPRSNKHLRLLGIGSSTIKKYN